ncbi:EAL domain-containing protein [Thermoclostridium caenicola]|uniref:EAL domain, c-di-GMP-specific phosphodiesterase class I (Or its enzymatically inactive variant) n=1 Tax=Thermoclostridium caenicola TaxID=659425 RepID=A0A1M6FHD6_9FIRM|nr:EAL domain-containing protein [Thermoclostridium caenicola]SHI97056.1 EAL domain, c-di-GMP-specific phosphodiesterase class I (or its enzymatically inactive variant) [Thermoclostridium caenicola]
MKLAVQKAKSFMALRTIMSLIGLLSFIALMATSIAMTAEVDNAALCRIVIIVCAILYVASFCFEFAMSRKTARELEDLARILSDIGGEIGVSLERDEGTQAVTVLSDMLNRSLKFLDEKNLRLESELKRNERLSESISDFYSQMRTLKETGVRIDFFEYDYVHRIFVFATGLFTFLEDNEDIFEITADDLFERFSFSISKETFEQLVNRCVSHQEPLDLEFSVAREDGKIRWLKLWGRLSADGARITGAIMDITREVVQRNLEKERAIRDNMTGFYNRNALTEVAGKAMAECADGEMVAFVYIGLTGYQEFQERYGMIAGNSYIRVCAEVLRKFLTPCLIPFRWLGADFLLLATHVRSLESFREEMEGIIQKVQKYMGDVDGIAVSFQLAVGYALSGIDGDVPADLLEYASFAENEVLRGERESPNPFNRERYEEAKRAALRRTFIKDIIDRNQLSIVFQPIVSLKTGELYGFEALSRPTNPIYRNIEELIEDAEATGHYAILEKRMVYNALDAYMLRDEHFRDHYLFINTAPFATLEEQDYNDIRDRYFGHMKVVFEVMERKRMDPDAINLRKSIVIKAGAKFALDDFGSGYSNHLALLALEPDIIKIDKELVRGVNSDLRKQHMIEDIISYARYRGTRVLAEGIETREELETLCRMGIDYAQGYFLGMPSSELTEPYEQAREIIRAMGKHQLVGLGNLLILLRESMAGVDSEMACHAAVTAYLVLKMGLKLRIRGERLAGLITAAMLRDMGTLSGESDGWRNPGRRGIPGHSLYACLVMKEYYPYDRCPEAVLYHHLPWSERGAALEAMDYPDEADILSLADEAACLILDDPGTCMEEEMVQRLESSGHDSRNVSVFAELCRAGILKKAASGDFMQNLLNVSGRLHVGRSEIEGIIRTYVYTLLFRMPHLYAHARVMETLARFLARLTKQNWKLVDMLGLASLIYNLGRLPRPGEGPVTADNAYEEHLLIRSRLKTVAHILKEAGLGDIMNMMHAACGTEGEVSGNHMLMVRDIASGARILNIADIFASLLEERPGRPAMNCTEAVYELAGLVRAEEGYLPIVETMQEYVDDIESRIQTAKAEIEKRYRSIMDTWARLQAE